MVSPRQDPFSPARPQGRLHSGPRACVCRHLVAAEETRGGQQGLQGDPGQRGKAGASLKHSIPFDMEPRPCPLPRTPHLGLRLWRTGWSLYLRRAFCMRQELTQHRTVRLICMSFQPGTVSLIKKSRWAAGSPNLNCKSKVRQEEKGGFRRGLSSGAPPLSEH